MIRIDGINMPFSAAFDASIDISFSDSLNQQRSYDSTLLAQRTYKQYAKIEIKATGWNANGFEDLQIGSTYTIGSVKPVYTIDLPTAGYRTDAGYEPYKAIRTKYVVESNKYFFFNYGGEDEDNPNVPAELEEIDRGWIYFKEYSAVLVAKSVSAGNRAESTVTLSFVTENEAS